MRTKTTSIYVNESLADALTQGAKEHNVSRGTFTRMCLDNGALNIPLYKDPRVFCDTWYQHIRGEGKKWVTFPDPVGWYPLISKMSEAMNVPKNEVLSSLVVLGKAVFDGRFEPWRG